MNHTIIKANGATVSNVLNTGRRGLISVALLRLDAGYAVQATVIGDAPGALRHFANIAEAEAVYALTLRGIKTARAMFGN